MRHVGRVMDVILDPHHVVLFTMQIEGKWVSVSFSSLSINLPRICVLKHCPWSSSFGGVNDYQK